MASPQNYISAVSNGWIVAPVVLPFIFNDTFPLGNFASDTGTGAVDIYSFDFYPEGWSPGPVDPSDWESSSEFPAPNFTTHEQISHKTPFSLSEFQGGCPDPWGGVGVEFAVAYISQEFERVFYKLNYGFRVAILAFICGYTSYDVGAAIAENREVNREKYSELKLQAGFLQASPAYLTTQPDGGSTGVYTNTDDIFTTALVGPLTTFYIIRHRNITSLESIQYQLNINTSLGVVTIPQLGGHLSLNGRDSKFHVADYDMGGINLIYSTAEIFSWNTSGSKSILVLYGGENETHEFAVPASLGSPFSKDGSGLKASRLKSSIVVQWQVEPSRQIIEFGTHLEVHLLWRHEAYNYWVLDLPAPKPLGLHVSPSRSDKSVIIRAGYLIRSANILDHNLYLTGDINSTTKVEVISTTIKVSSLFFNGERVLTQICDGRLTGTLSFATPTIVLPDLEALTWRYINSLPELSDEYDDGAWDYCDQTTSNNPRNLSTPTSLYASDYGYNSGSLLYRGHFLANGSESCLYLLTEGGYAFGHSVWLNSTYLGSWPGGPGAMLYNQTLCFPEKLQPGKLYIPTVLVDHMGVDENFPANVQVMKDPRGLLDYDLKGREKAAVSWKITGNLGGEKYLDLSRGPLNEGAMFGERQGYHLPGAPISKW